MATFVVDCGHGGDSSDHASTPVGVVGPGGLREKDVTLALGRRVAHHLGGEAFLTRDADHNLSLARRADIARGHRADVFISLHANEGPRGSRGPETWLHTRASRSSRMLAESIQRELSRYGGVERGVRSGEMALLTPERLDPRTAACLVEVDYLSDPEGERRLRDPASLDALAQAIARGAREAQRWSGAGAEDGASARALGGRVIPISWSGLRRGNWEPIQWLNPEDTVWVQSSMNRSLTGTDVASEYLVTLDVYGTQWETVQTARFPIDGSVNVTPVWRASSRPGNHRVGIFIDEIASSASPATYDVNANINIASP
jgi:hypothetical protein